MFQNSIDTPTTELPGAPLSYLLLESNTLAPNLAKTTLMDEAIG